MASTACKVIVTHKSYKERCWRSVLLSFKWPSGPPLSSLMCPNKLPPLSQTQSSLLLTSTIDASKVRLKTHYHIQQLLSLRTPLKREPICLEEIFRQATRGGEARVFKWQTVVLKYCSYNKERNRGKSNRREEAGPVWEEVVTTRLTTSLVLTSTWHFQSLYM